MFTFQGELLTAILRHYTWLKPRENWASSAVREFVFKYFFDILWAKFIIKVSVVS